MSVDPGSVEDYLSYPESSDSDSGGRLYRPSLTKKAIALRRAMLAQAPRIDQTLVMSPVGGVSMDHVSRAQTDYAAMMARANSINADYLTRFYMSTALYPNQSPGFHVGVAAAGLDPTTATTSDLARLDSEVQQPVDGPGVQRAGSPSAGSPYVPKAPDQPNDFLPTLSRNFFAALSVPYEAMMGGLRTAGGALAEDSGPDFAKAALGLASGTMLMTPAGFAVTGIGEGVYGDQNFQSGIEQTDMGQTLAEVPNAGLAAFTDRQKYINPETGHEESTWFVNENSPIGEAQRRETFQAWAVNGQSWTLGRGTAAAVRMDPNSTAYSVLSGFIDAAATLTLDPVNYVPVAGVMSKGTAALGKTTAFLAPKGTRIENLGKALADAGRRTEIVDEYARVNNIDRSQALQDFTDAREQVARDDVTEWLRQQRPVAREEQQAAIHASAAESAALDVEPLRQAEAELASVIEEHRALQGIMRNRQIGERALSGDAEARLAAQEAAAADETQLGTIADALIGTGSPTKARLVKEFGLSPKQAEETLASLEGRGILTPKDARGRRSVVEGATFSRAVPEAPSRSVVPADDVVVDANLLLANRPVQSIIEATRTEVSTFLDGAVSGDPLSASKGTRSFDAGVYSGQDAVVYWTSKKAPVLADIDQALPTAVAQRLWGKVEEKYSKRALRDIRGAGDSDPLVLAVTGQIDGTRDLRPMLQEMLTSPDTTWSDALATFGKAGLSRWVDDAMRAEGVDGISGLTRGSGHEGVWWGIDNPNIEARTIGLGDQAAAGLDFSIGAQVGTTGMRTLDRSAALGQMSRLRARASVLRKTLDTVHEAAHITARGTADARNEVLKTSDRAFDSTFPLWGDDKWTAELARMGDDDMRKALEAGAAQKGSWADFIGEYTSMRATLKHEFGATYPLGRPPVVDYGKVRSALFGAGPARMIADKVIGKMTAKGISTGALHRLTNGKWDAETYRLLAANAASDLDDAARVDEAYRILSERIGLVDSSTGNVAVGSAPVTLTDVWRAKGNGLDRASGLDLRRGNVFAQRMAAQRPGGRMVNLGDAEEVAKYIRDLGTFAKRPTKEIDGWVSTFLDDAIPGAVEAASRVALLNAHDALIKHTVEKGVSKFEGILVDQFDSKAKNVEPVWRDEVLTRLANSLQVWRKDIEDVRLFYLDRYRDGTGDGVLAQLDGTTVPLPSVHHDGELANGWVWLPPVDEVEKVVTKAGRMKIKGAKSDAIANFLDVGFSDVFRTAMLVRPAYIARNVLEMNMRMFLGGRVSMLNHPLAYIGMVMGDQDGGWIRRGLAGFDRYRNTVIDDRNFRDIISPEMQESSGHIYDHYADVINARNSTGDVRAYRYAKRSENTHVVGFEDPKFAKGWANELLSLRSGRVSKRVARALRDGEDPQVVVKDILYSPSFENVRNQMRLSTADTGTYEMIFSDEALASQWLFDGAHSIAARITEFTGFGRAGTGAASEHAKALLDFAAGDELRVMGKGGGVEYKYNPVFDYRNRVDGKTYKELENALNRMKPALSGSEIARSNVILSPPPNAMTGKVKKSVDWFFTKSARAERLGAMGPEYRVRYAEEVARYADMLDAGGRAALIESLEKNVVGIRLPGGRSVHRQDPMLKALRQAKGDGPLTNVEVHRVASKAASDHVKRLFYDAQRRNNGWQAIRLAVPFGQAWGNTLATWTRLAVEKPERLYSGMKGLDAGYEEGSNTIYEAGGLGGAYDPNQGFLFDNGDGDTQFIFPAAMGVAGGALTAYNLSSLNFAVGSESPFPGLGPAASIPYGMMPDSVKNNIPVVSDVIRSMAEPFGPKSPIEQFIPSYAQRIGAALAGEGGNSLRAQQDMAAAAWLSQNGQYDLQNDPFARDDLQGDIGVLGRVLTGLRAIGQFALPASPQVRAAIYEKGSDRLVAQTMVADEYAHLLDQYNGDATTAGKVLVDEYGPGVLFYVMRSSTGQSMVPTSGAARFMREHPDLAGAYPEDFHVFFPEGNAADASARAWERELQGSTSIVPKDRVDKVAAQLDRIKLLNAEQRAIEAGLGPDATDAYLASVKEPMQTKGVEDPFLLRNPTVTVKKVYDMAVSHPEFGSTATGQGVIEAYNIRAQYLAQAQMQGVKTLRGSSEVVTALRRSYQRDLLDLTERYPGFGKYAYRAFYKEQKGPND